MRSMKPAAIRTGLRTAKNQGCGFSQWKPRAGHRPRQREVTIQIVKASVISKVAVWALVLIDTLTQMPSLSAALFPLVTTPAARARRKTYHSRVNRL